MKTKSLLSRSGLLQTELYTKIDLRPILQECMGEMQLLKELITIFHRNALEFIGAAKVHLFNADFKSLQLAAHKIKTGLAMMHTDNLHALIVSIEKECNGNQDPKHLQFLCDCFSAEYPQVKVNIDTALTGLDLG